MIAVAEPTPEPQSTLRQAGLIFVRFVLPALCFIGAFVMYGVADTRATGVEGLAMGIGAGLSILLINAFWRYGFEGDKEREQEEAARRYLDEHGHWPDEEE